MGSNDEDGWETVVNGSNDGPVVEFDASASGLRLGFRLGSEDEKEASP